MNTLTETNVRLFASAKSWIEGEALRQLYATSKLEGMRLAVGFPDLHPGKGSAVGAAFVTEGLIYPYLIGGDIGCGMDRRNRPSSRTRWTRVPLLKLSELLGAEITSPSSRLLRKFSTPASSRSLAWGKQQLVTLVHSGSRGLGESVLRDYVAEHQASGSDTESFAAAAYLQGHDLAVRWAKVNRKLLAERFAQALGAEASLLWDGCHNSITPREFEGETIWVHRKGAVVAEDENVMIPGSRGALSYLVQPLGDGESRAWSLAHGAGRKWARSEARVRMRERFGKEQLVQTSLGSRVICGERDLLYEEAPAAYKNIEAVIEDLVDAGLVSVIATFRPLLTYKTRADQR